MPVDNALTARLVLTRPDPLESIRQKDVIATLERHPAVSQIHRINVGKFRYMQYGIVGHTDLLIWLKPRFGTRLGFVELKRPGKKPTAEQTEFMDEMRVRGHVCFVATHGAAAWDEFERQLQKDS